MINAGDLLIAPPRMRDPRFHRSVMLITQSGLNGVQALAINRPMDRTVNDVIDDLDLHLDQDHVLYWGGPVAAHTLWFLHSREWRGQNTLTVNDRYAVTSCRDMFATLNSQNQPEYGRFCLGLAGWAPGQLESEMEDRGPWPEESAWLIAQCPEPQEMFHVAPQDMWEWACELSARQAVTQWMV